MLPSRYWPFVACLLLTVAFGAALAWTPVAGWGLAIFGGLSVVGIIDLLQRKQALRRNYPVSAHFRYGLRSEERRVGKEGRAGGARGVGNEESVLRQRIEHT